MNVPVIVGPTASGKTDVGLVLARLLDGEIISADSRQVYRRLNIGTAKPTAAQLARVKHHFINILEPGEPYSAGEFGVQGRRVIDEIIGRKKTPIVVGGSGLYVASLIDGLFEGPGADGALRTRLEQRAAADGIGELLEELQRVDPAAAGKADPTKPRRIIRALEVYYLTGVPLSHHHREARSPIGFTPVLFGLHWDRSQLYERIEQRCDEMLARGLLREIEELELSGVDMSANALNTVGYAEAIAYRRGAMPFDEMVKLFRQNSRRYAKRQLTWFRRDPRIRWLEMGGGVTVEEVAGQIAREFGAIF